MGKFFSACTQVYFGENFLRKFFGVSLMHSRGLKFVKSSVGYHRNFISLTDHSYKRITRISTTTFDLARSFSLSLSLFSSTNLTHAHKLIHIQAPSSSLSSLHSCTCTKRRTFLQFQTFNAFSHCFT